MTIKKEWSLVSSHGAVLMYIAVYPDCTIEQISESMSLTKRTVWGIVGQLKQSGLLHIRKEGRRHHYRVNLDGPFKHPTILKNTPLRVVFGDLIRHHSRSQPTHRS